MGRKSLCTPEIEALLGQVPDIDIAVASGVSVSSVMLWRKKAGLAPYKAPKQVALDAEGNEIVPEPVAPKVAKKKGRGPSKLLTPEVLSILGTVPDIALAKELKVSIQTIAGWRKKNNIATFVSAESKEKTPKETVAKTVTVRIQVPEEYAARVKAWAIEQGYQCKEWGDGKKVATASTPLPVPEPAPVAVDAETPVEEVDAAPAESPEQGPEQEEPEEVLTPVEGNPEEEAALLT